MPNFTDVHSRLHLASSQRKPAQHTVDGKPLLDVLQPRARELGEGNERLHQGLPCDVCAVAGIDEAPGGLAGGWTGGMRGRVRSRESIARRWGSLPGKRAAGMPISCMRASSCCWGVVSGWVDGIVACSGLGHRTGAAGVARWVCRGVRGCSMVITCGVLTSTNLRLFFNQR